MPWSASNLNWCVATEEDTYMCQGMNHCEACLPRAEQKDVMGYETLTLHERPHVDDFALSCTMDKRRRANIREAVRVGDVLIFNLPELAKMVHTRPADVYIVGGHYDHYRRACSKAYYPEFRKLATEHGIELPYGSPGRKRTRRRRVRAAHNCNLLTMSVLLFAFEYGYNVHALSVAVNAQKANSPVLGGHPDLPTSITEALNASKSAAPVKELADA